MNEEHRKEGMKESGDLINGLKHMADDHPCCNETIHAAIRRIEATEPPLDRADGSRGSFRQLIRNLRKGYESGEFLFCKRCKVHYHAHNAEHHKRCENTEQIHGKKGN